MAGDSAHEDANRTMTPLPTGAANDRSETLDVYLGGLTVGIIATPRKKLEMCDVSERLASVVERNQSNQFDFIPVIRSEGSEAQSKIVGLIELANFREPLAAGVLVSVHMQLLSEADLIGADADILKFVRDADRRRCRLVISGHQIAGLISLSDLQKLPVRVALFGMITHLEMLMTNVIRSEFGDSSNWMTRLSCGRQKKTQGKIDTAVREDMFVGDALGVDALLFTEFCDKITIIKNRNVFPWNSRCKFERELGRAEGLRNSLAHASDYDAANVCETVRLTLTWIDQLSACLKTSTEPL